MNAHFVTIDLLPILKGLSPQNIVDKVWGKEYWITNNEKYCFKLLKLNPGYQSSMHYHNIKDETFIVVDGVVELEFTDCDTILLKPGDRQRIIPGVAHRFKTKNGALVFEISLPHSDADVVRLEDSRKTDSIANA